MNKVNLLWLNDRLNTLGGIETLLLDIAKALDSNRFKIYLGTFKTGYVADYFKDVGVEVLEIPKRSKFDLSSIPYLKQAILKHDIHMLHTHSHFPGITGRIAAKLTGRKVISTYHLGLHEDGHPKSTKILTKISLPLADYVTFVSRGVEESFYSSSSVFQRDDLGKKKHFTIYNGVDVEALLKKVEDVDVASIRKELAIGEKDTFLLSAGRLAEQKGQYYLIMAMKEIVRSHPNAKLLIFGEGELEEYLKQLITDNSLNQNVFIFPPTNRIATIMNACDIFILSSLFEGLPMALIEVMGIGKPVVATNVTGINEVITQGLNGLLVPSCNIDSLAKEISALIDDRNSQLRLTDSASQTIFTSFSKKAMMDNYLKIYDFLSH